MAGGNAKKTFKDENKSKITLLAVAAGYCVQHLAHDILTYSTNTICSSKLVARRGNTSGRVLHKCDEESLYMSCWQRTRPMHVLNSDCLGSDIIQPFQEPCPAPSFSDQVRRPNLDRNARAITEEKHVV